MAMRALRSVGTVAQPHALSTPSALRWCARLSRNLEGGVLMAAHV